MKEKDKLLFCHLRNNDRLPLTILSRRIKIPVSTLYDRIKANEKNQVILRHTTLINFSKIGFPIKAFIEINVTHDKETPFINYLKKHQNINNAYKINNKYNYIIEGVFKNLQSTDTFINELEDKFNITDREIHFIINDIVRENFLTNQDYLNIISG
ncbi:MAG: hypothetical protein GWP09_00640 [Nitrospiraceae bacterium]|nr:hypothetical protein [Nitrospiraceae bacterium]